MRGEVVNRLVYRDHLNPFHQVTMDDNLIQTYLPIVDQDPVRPIGVFAVYSDANDIVHGAETKQLIVIPVVLGSLLVLYLLLLSIVHRASRTIERQRGVILERTRTLELLSTKLLNAQEDERKRIAENLQVFDFALSDDEMAAISALTSRGVRICDFAFSPKWDQPDAA